MAVSTRRTQTKNLSCAVMLSLHGAITLKNSFAVSCMKALHAASFGSFHAAALGYINHYFRGRNQGRGQAIYTSLTFGLGGTLGGLYAGYAWERLGPGLTFTGAALCALAGMLVLRAKLDPD